MEPALYALSADDPRCRVATMKHQPIAAKHWPCRTYRPNGRQAYYAQQSDHALHGKAELAPSHFIHLFTREPPGSAPSQTPPRTGNGVRSAGIPRNFGRGKGSCKGEGQLLSSLSRSSRLLKNSKW